MNNPVVHFDASEESIVKSTEIVKEFVPFLEDMKMYYYFPFLPNESTDCIRTQIQKDTNSFRLHEAKEGIEKAWARYAPLVTPKLQNLKPEPDATEYKCVLTFYGPYGYYYTPNIIYINITKCNPDEWIETMLHELLHLIFSEKIADMEHLEEERFIDSTFVELFGEIFPNYKVQNI